MLFGNDKLYDDVRNVKIGKKSLPNLLDKVANKVSATYSINVLYVLYDKIELGENKGRPRLTIIVETSVDSDKLRKASHTTLTLKPDIEKEIKRIFSETVNAANESAKYPHSNLHVVLDCFSTNAINRALGQFVKNNANQLTSEFSKAKVWNISQDFEEIIVFLQTDNDIKNCKANGDTEKIRKRCHELAKNYDEFGYLTNKNFHLRFDSKENLDKNYQGNLFYYFR